MLCLVLVNDRVSSVYGVDDPAACSMSYFDEGTGEYWYATAITEPADLDSEGLFPKLSPADGLLVGGAVASLWVLAFAIRAVRQAL